eukprot:Blabericola_migrator_1__1502@NODE_1398_length_4628_cov_70_136812_g687_i1_p4_GENE_NODE_1398_length_4628_cov_70_136812_g687_i1NODE_1398_length_4628_cov_70_136812_g687_i1_p4_ORF_typecomplete_len118_score15_44Glutaredoxin/PF00462_24/7_5e12GST_N_3/PF13417_6/0_01SH3BGR/PF04908_15/2_4e03SH3BGR/PF04908_15/0_052DUF836/PF05768_14/0_096_NODE_1398_length_4628_cov_70_136812_g687_i117212074
MLVKDGWIVKIFQEPDVGYDPYGVSDADTMLKFINPDAKPPPRIAMITKVGCPYCAGAKALLDSRGIRYADIPLSDAVRGYVVGAITGKKTVPQIWIDGQYIGGSEDLKVWIDQRHK